MLEQGSEDERAREAEWINRQRSGWGSPTRWGEGCLGPTGSLGILILFLILFAMMAVARLVGCF